jgi:hypothetical protein
MPWSVYNSNGKLLQSLAIGDDSIVEGKLDVSNAPTNGQFLQAQSAEGGGLTWAAAGADISARVTHGSAQSVANESWTTLTFTATDRFDTDVIHDTSTNPSRLTCKTAGKYIIIGQVEWTANATGERVIRILKGGSTEVGKTGDSSVSNVSHTQNVLTLVDLAVNEYVELSAYQTSGGSLTIRDAGEYSPEFMMIKIA